MGVGANVTPVRATVTLVGATVSSSVRSPAECRCGASTRRQRCTDERQEARTDNDRDRTDWPEKNRTDKRERCRTELSRELPNTSELPLLNKLLRKGALPQRLVAIAGRVVGVGEIREAFDGLVQLLGGAQRFDRG
jgi:hypothetical protein